MDTKSIIGYIIQIGAACGGFILFIRGFSDYRRNSEIKRAEFLNSLIQDFNKPEHQLALRMLDDFNISESQLCDDFVNQHLIGQNCEGNKLDIILRNHVVSPVTLKSEIIIRDSFCNLLDFLTKLSYYLQNNLITKRELCYFRYYIEKIKQKEEVKKFICYYFYPYDFNILFEGIEQLADYEKRFSSNQYFDNV